MRNRYAEKDLLQKYKVYNKALRSNSGPIVITDNAREAAYYANIDTKHRYIECTDKADKTFNFINNKYIVNE